MCQIQRALYDTVHNHKGGAPSLAQYMDIRPGTLSNKVDPAMEHQKLNVFEMLLLMKLTGNYSALTAIAMECGFTLMPIADMSSASDMELLTLYTRLNKELGDIAETLHKNLEDGEIRQSEHDRLVKEAGDAHNAINALIVRSKALVVPDPAEGAERKLKAV